MLLRITTLCIALCAMLPTLHGQGRQRPQQQRPGTEQQAFQRPEMPAEARKTQQLTQRLRQALAKAAVNTPNRRQRTEIEDLKFYYEIEFNEGDNGYTDTTMNVEVFRNATTKEIDSAWLLMSPDWFELPVEVDYVKAVLTNIVLVPEGESSEIGLPFDFKNAILYGVKGNFSLAFMRMTQQFDANDRMTESLTEEFAIASWMPASKEVHVYDAKGQHIEMNYYEWDENSSDWEQAFGFRADLEETAGKVTKSEMYDISGGIEMLYLTTEYYYGTDGEMSSFLNAADGFVLDSNSITWHSFDADAFDVNNWPPVGGGNYSTIVSYQYNEDDNEWVEINRNVRTVNAADRPVRIINEAFIGPNQWYLSNEEVYTYDAKGNQTLYAYIAHWAGTPDTMYKTVNTYAYNGRGYKTEVVAIEFDKDWDTGEFMEVWNTKEVYVYEGESSVPNAPGLARFTAYPNPVSGPAVTVDGIVRANYVVQVYDMKGRLAGQQNLNLENGSQLNLGQLPQGIYQVRLNSPQQAYTARIVVQ